MRKVNPLWGAPVSIVIGCFTLAADADYNLGRTAIGKCAVTLTVLACVAGLTASLIAWLDVGSCLDGEDDYE